MNEKCRLCLKIVQCEKYVSILDIQFSKRLATIFQFTIAVGEALPERVCQLCQSTVDEFHSYYLQVQTNQKQLSSLHVLNETDDAFPLTTVKVEPLFDEHLFETEANDIGRIDSVKDESLKETVDGSDSDSTTSDDSNGDDMLLNDEDDKQEDNEGSEAIVHVRRRGRNLKKERTDAPGKTERTDKSKCTTQAKHQEKEQRIRNFFSLECELCSAPLNDFTDLQDHYRQVHNVTGYVRCCDRLFYRRYLLLDHIDAHSGTIRCEICQKSYKSNRYLTLHMAKTHSREEDRPFKCDQCHVSYPKSYLLKAHRALHVQEECRICKKVLSNNQSLKVHIAQMHGDDGNHICDTCGKVFRTKAAMERHIKEHLGLELVERMQCEYCKKWFNGKYNLKKHIRFLHNEEGQEFRCDICQHESPNSRALANHKLRVHVEEKYECEYCGKRFKRRPNLREHIASHTGNALYSCEICGIKFNSKANRFTHRKNKHPVEWEANKRLKAEREMSKHCV
ncbi:transcription factor grauzone-like [Anopheles cruzii]|uniref:transcription factor grauzone-like n=1 Tax=Anopheles cruzii TaxID=68878 RepID=UPI0022EC3D63|nr:transcription factor grauzone-like [Anopheles cruzii]